MSSSVFHKGLSITLSVVMHAVLIAVLFMGVPFARERAHVPPGPQVLAIEAVYMDSAALEQMVAARQTQQRAADEQRDREAAEAAEAAAAAARAQQQADEQRAAQQRLERDEAERAEQARLQQLQLEREQEAQRRADEQARLAEAEAEAERQRQDEQRRREEEEARLAEQRAEEEQRQREEAEQRRREEELARQQAEAEAELSRMLDAEAARRAAEESGLLGQYRLMIEQRIEQNWIRPASAGSGLSCVVHVQQIPSGDVVDVRIGQCNGDDAVRRSIEAAVHRASPLPLPPVPALFSRNLQLTFEPEV